MSGVQFVDAGTSPDGARKRITVRNASGRRIELGLIHWRDGDWKRYVLDTSVRVCFDSAMLRAIANEIDAVPVPSREVKR